jgi:DNA invertase Pin-like site-specific DNA recombinase/predicted transcriptional regulator
MADKYRPSTSIAAQKAINERRRAELKVAAFTTDGMDFHIVEDGQTGTEVLARDAIRVVESLIKNLLITHLFMANLDRLARSTTMEALAFVGLLCDFAIKVVTETKVYDVADRDDRIALLNALDRAQQESEAMSERQRRNRAEALRRLHWSSRRAPFGMFTKKCRDGRLELRYLPNAKTIIQGLVRVSLIAGRTKNPDYRRLVVHANRRYQRSWTGKYTPTKLRAILSDYTYRGFYVNKSTGQREPAPKLNILTPFNCKSLDRMLQRWKGSLAEIPINSRYTRWTLERLLERTGACLLEILDGEFVRPCPNPTCRKALLARVTSDEKVSIYNGGKITKGVWLPFLQCTVCKRRYFAYTREDLHRMTKGVRCIQCGVPNRFECSFFEGHQGRNRDTVRALRLLKVTCLKCRIVFYLSCPEWRNTYPFSEEIERIYKEMRRREPTLYQRRSQQQQTQIDRRIKKLHARGLSDAEISRLTAFRGVRRARVRLGLASKYRRRSRIRDSAALRLYANGWTDSAIAKYFGLKNSAVFKWRRRKGLPTKRGWYHALERRNKEVKRDFFNGLTDGKIAAKYKVSMSSVTAWRLRWGLRGKIRLAIRKRNGIKLPRKGTSAIKDEIAMRLYHRGLSDKEIGKRFRLTGGAVFHWRKRKGLESKRPRHSVKCK